MSTNPHFYEYASSNEQALLDDIVIESIQVKGFNTFYVKRTFNSIDQILGEDALTSFKDAYSIEMLLESFDGYAGEGQFISKFGIESKNKLTFVVSSTRFKEELGEAYARPLEGDLIFWPFIKSFFEIIYVDDNAPFYKLGKKFTYKIFVQSWNYSNEDVKINQHVMDSKLPEIATAKGFENNDEFNAFGNDIASGTNIFGVKIR